MKNILKDTPYVDLHGRAKFNCEYIKTIDIKGKDVIDIGSGYGWFSNFALNQNVKSIVGIDPNIEDINTAKSHISNPQSTFQVGSAIDIPEKDQTFDTAVSWEVIEHIPKNSEVKMFEEAYRILKPGGTFYLSTPYDNFFAKIFDPAWWLIGHRHYSKSQLNSYAKNAGFIVEDIYVGGKWWEIINVNNRLISKWIFRRNPFFEKFIDDKRDKEYNPNIEGFTNIFIKCRKTK